MELNTDANFDCIFMHIIQQNEQKSEATSGTEKKKKKKHNI